MVDLTVEVNAEVISWKGPFTFTDAWMFAYKSQDTQKTELCVPVMHMTAFI